MKRILTFVSATLIFMILLSTRCTNYNFEETTFKGYTKQGTIVALDIESKDGKIKGFGFHRFSSCVLNRVEFEGKIDDKGKVKFDEIRTNNGRLFGSIEGVYNKELETIECIWRNSKGFDPTKIELKACEPTSDEILTILPACNNEKGFWASIGSVMDNL